MAKKELTARLFVGDVPVETLTPEQRDEVARRFSEILSYYYTAHPDELQMLENN